MRKRVTFEQWLKLAVTVSDIRPFEGAVGGLDGYDFFRCDKPVPGVLFMKPIDPEFAPKDAPPRYDMVGVIRQLDNGRWYVIVGNMDPEFASFQEAAKYLWDSHWSSELDPGPRYRLIGVDREGDIIVNKVVKDFYAIRPIVLEHSDDYTNGIMEDLEKVGSRFAEWPHGHWVAFPLEDE